MGKIEFVEKYIQSNFDVKVLESKLGLCSNNAFRMKCSRYLRDPEVIKHIEAAKNNIRRSIGDNYNYKLHKLKLVAERAISENGEPPLEGYAVGDGIRAIQEANKMEGHLAAEKHAHVNINADVDLKQLEEIAAIYLKDY
jgi:hypothetical protein